MQSAGRTFTLSISFLVLLGLSGCASINWPFTKEIMNREPLARIDRIAVLDVPAGDQLLNKITRDEMKYWLEQAGKEVILVDADRKNPLKMLEDYSQFNQLEADAVLEIAYYMLGYENDLARGVGGKKLSPHTFLKYRLVSTKDGKILIQSNVRYSSFSYNLDLMEVPGTRLLGPRADIFPDQKSSEGKSEEIKKRLENAIHASTESIAHVITNNDQILRSSYSGIRASAMDYFYSEAEEEVNTGTYDNALWSTAAGEAGSELTARNVNYVELRAKALLRQSEDFLSCSGANRSSKSDISGTYVSDITCEQCDYFRRYKDRTMVVRLRQAGDSFTGVSNASKDSSITGQREGDHYRFIYFSAPNSYEIRGEWKVDTDGCGLSGKWGHSVNTAGGTWHLTRIR